MPLVSLEAPPISDKLTHDLPPSPSSSSSEMSQPGPSSLSKLRDLTLGSAGEHLKQEIAAEMPMMCEDGDEDSSQFSMSPREHFDHESDLCMRYFESWTQIRQTEFVEQLVARMSFHQHEHIYSILMPMLQRDFITALPGKGLHHIAYKILSYLDERSLCRAELVCHEWYQVISEGLLWKKLIQRKVASEPVWKGLSERRGWGKYLFRHVAASEGINHQFFRQLYPSIISDISNMESNWKNARHTLTRIECHSENSKGVYCLQYDDHKIISGLRDNTIKIWNRDNMECTRILQGHTGSVLCLQYDEKVIVTGSSDSTIRVWGVDTGVMLNTLVHHCEAVLHLRFSDTTMVTCSKDRTIAVWDMRAPHDIVLRRVLVGHRAAVNVVDFDDRYIVSASGDRTIKVWRTSTSEFVRTLHGHRRGIACLQYRGNHVVSGSSDNTIRIWDIECGACLKLLEGHDDLVRCIRFDDKRIVSGAYDGAIKVWDFQAALDPRAPTESLCVRTLSEHSGRVFRLQFDDFQIISSSHDDTILIWDFLDPVAPGPMEIEQPQQATPDTPQGTPQLPGLTSAVAAAAAQDSQQEHDDSASSPDSGTFKPPPST